jgi:hypothetical protein
MWAPLWDKIKAFLQQSGVVCGNSKIVVRLHLGGDCTTNTQARIRLSGSQPKCGNPYDPFKGGAG